VSTITNDNQEMATFIQMQINELQRLYNNNEDTMTPTRLNVLQSEIEGLKLRMQRYLPKTDEVKIS